MNSHKSMFKKVNYIHFQYLELIFSDDSDDWIKKVKNIAFMSRVLIIFVLVSFVSVGDLLANEDLDDDDPVQLQNDCCFSEQVVISQEHQNNLGIITEEVKEVKFRSEYVFYGQVIDIVPLLSIMEQHINISSQQAIAKAKLDNSSKAVSRLKNLHQKDVASIKQLLEQKTQYLADKAEYELGQSASRAILDKSRREWCDVIVHWVAGRKSQQFEHILKGKKFLIKLFVPLDYADLQHSKYIDFSLADNSGKLVKANLLCELPVVNVSSQNKQLIYLADSSELKTGMRMMAKVHKVEESSTGILVPKSAVIWHLGQPFFFIKKTGNTFLRYPVTVENKVSEGFFVAVDIDEVREIVVLGAQMLLSYEFKSRIPEEDDD